MTKHLQTSIFAYSIIYKQIMHLIRFYSLSSVSIPLENPYLNREDFLAPPLQYYHLIGDN